MESRFEALMRESVQGFTEYCGFTPISMQAGSFVARITLQPHHLQQDGFAHAGVVSLLADHTAGYAAFTLVPEDRRILTVEYKINLLAPAHGEYVECRARVIKPGKRLLITESDVFAVRGGDERLVAKALLTMAAVPAEKVALQRPTS